MGKQEKKKAKRQPPPVLTGHDGRPEKREGPESPREQASGAPDGVSGNWS